MSVLVMPCKHSDFMTPETCTICKTGPTPPPKPLRVMSRSTARITWPCMHFACLVPVAVGDPICLVGRSDDDHIGWMHADCADEVT